MVALYITSSEAGAGKTTICAGLSKNLADSGKKVGYLRASTNAANADCAFMKRLLSLEEPLDKICPVIADPGQIKEAYAKVSTGKDVVIIEGEKLDGNSLKIADALDARVIIVEGYPKNLAQAMNSYKDFGKRLLGVVLNKVPKSQLKRVHDELSAKFGEAGIKLLGVIPEDRALLTMTVGELASLQGKMLDGEKQASELVENVMLGAMYVGSGLEYFGRKSNKAVVLRSERPDMQLAALETSTRCLVLSGDAKPTSLVLRRAKEKKVPIILTQSDAVTAVNNIETALGRARFNQEKKLPRLAEIMKQSFDFKAVYHGLGFAK